jgi:CheY-like chemotaxis protein
MDRPVPARRFARILLVDDDAQVLAAATSLLNECSCQVITARTMAETEWRMASGQFDVMMTELTMPQCSGWELARRSKQLWQHKPVILVTGWGKPMDAKKMRAGLGDGVIAKPFSIEDLIQAFDNLGGAARANWMESGTMRAGKSSASSFAHGEE